MNVIHPLPPVIDGASRTLILGTMPSPKSRAAGFYYAHPQNRFFPALAAVYGEPVPMGNDTRTAFLHRHGLALWDVLAACEIDGASDASIREPVPNDVASLLRTAPISRIFCTGGTAARLYRQLLERQTGRPCIPLPSPSAANCRMPFSELVRQYQVLRKE